MLNNSHVKQHYLVILLIICLLLQMTTYIQNGNDQVLYSVHCSCLNWRFIYQYNN